MIIQSKSKNMNEGPAGFVCFAISSYFFVAVMSAILFNRFLEKICQDVFLSAGWTGGDHSFLCDVQRFAACDMNNVIFKQWI